LTSQTPQDPPRPRRQVRRRKPRRRATGRDQAQEQLDRYDKLLNKWIQELVTVSKKIDTYRKKVMYYQGRLVALTTAEMAALEQATRDAEQGTRALRAIESE